MADLRPIVERYLQDNGMLYLICMEGKAPAEVYKEIESS